MLNDISNELNESRVRRLMDMPNSAITGLVIDAMEKISPGAIHGLQGVDADSDGLTKTCWGNAIISAENVGAIVYGGEALEMGHDLTHAEPVIFEDAAKYVADRVAQSILTLHGYESLQRKQRVYVVVTINKYGYINDVEVMDTKPSQLARGVDGTTISVFAANINGGDSNEITYDDHVCTGP